MDLKGIIKRDIELSGDITESVHNFIKDLKEFINAFALREDNVLKELRIALNFFKMPNVGRALGPEGISAYFMARIMDMVKFYIVHDVGDVIRKAKRVGYSLEAVLNYPNVDVDKVFLIVKEELKKS